MEPALSEGTGMVGIRLPRPPRRGAIVVVEHPRRADFWMVKRVVGLPGERVEIAAGEVLIDGSAAVDIWGTGATHPSGHWTLADDEVFLLSDNRSATRADGRTFGPVTWRPMYRVLFSR